MIIWYDLETTGLDPAKDTILEVAAIATDDAFNEFSRFSAVTDAAAHIPFGTLDRTVQDMHGKSGLWLESLTADRNKVVPSVDVVGLEFARWIAKHVKSDYVVHRRHHMPDVYVVLDTADSQIVDARDWRAMAPIGAGSTIGFDRAFLQQRMPAAYLALSHRSLDVTAFNELAKRSFPDVHEARPKADPDKQHRAMYDVEISLACARYYAAVFGTWAAYSREYLKNGGV